MNYNEFEQQPSSNKIVLATIDAAKRLMGWELVDNNVYKLTNFNHKIVISVKEEHDSLTSVHDLESVVEGTYFLDRQENTLYLSTINGVNPNTAFLTVVVRFFFSNEPLSIPFDLHNGFDVYWEPILKSTSEFGNNIDTINQVGEAIDGTGNIQLINDSEFWNEVFDLWTFDNKSCSIYSWNREVPLDQIQILFRGFVIDKKYSSTNITFQLKDQFKELRQTIPLATIKELNALSGEDQDNYRQRMILGRVFGHRPINIDRVLNGYPLKGTARAIANPEINGVDLVFVNTEFLTQLSPQDNIIVDGIELEIVEVVNDTTLIFADDVDTTTFSPFWDIPIYVKPDNPKRYMNRIYNVAGHVVKEPVTVCRDNCTISTLFVDSNENIYENDYIYVGELGLGEIARVRSTSGQNLVFLSTSLSIAPSAGTKITRPSIQNVRIDDILLQYYRDYTFNAETGILTLRDTAELNSAPINSLGFDVTFTEDSRLVTGTGFSQLKPGWFIGVVGQAEYSEIHAIIDDNNLLLVQDSPYSATNMGRYKNIIMDEDKVISCDILGMTDDGTTTGMLLKTAPQICKRLLELSNLDSEFINEESFDIAHDVNYQEIGMVIPESYSDTNVPTFIDVMNVINKSVFGALVIKHIGTETELFYHVLQAKKDILLTKKFTQYDLLSFSFDSTSKNTVKTVIIEYQNREYNWTVKDSSYLTYSKINNNSQYVVNTTSEKIVSTKLITQADAATMASRWGFILSDSMGSFEFTTKLQGNSLNIGDVIEINHSKLFKRVGGINRRLFMVESVRKNGYNVKVKCIDFSNTFNRVACINDFTNDYFNATENEILYGGYITDENGMQDNLSETFGTNLIW